MNGILFYRQDIIPSTSKRTAKVTMGSVVLSAQEIPEGDGSFRFAAPEGSEVCVEVYDQEKLCSQTVVTPNATECANAFSSMGNTVTTASDSANEPAKPSCCNVFGELSIVAWNAWDGE
jgi:hypothetical protein